MKNFKRGLCRASLRCPVRLRNDPFDAGKNSSGDSGLRRDHPVTEAKRQKVAIAIKQAVVASAIFSKNGPTFRFIWSPGWKS